MTATPIKTTGKAIVEQGNLMVGHFGLGILDSLPQTVLRSVHDGDTINVRALGNFGARFLGVDAPEISFTLPGQSNFLRLDDPGWDQFLANPFDNQKYGPLTLEPGLKQFLLSHLGSQIGHNQYHHAVIAERVLEQEVVKDITALGQTPADFAFFFAFAYEILDRYGRLLGYINSYQRQGPGPRFVDYNSRLLKQGVVSPYFIWPNLNPFRRASSLLNAVVKPGTAKKVADGEVTLRNAREWVQSARQQGIGLFDRQNPLRLEPFEVRYLAQRRAPNRWVIDLSQNSDQLIPPQRYYTVPNTEDRLFIPEEFLALFKEAGWKV